MPSTFTTNTGIEKIGDGEQSGLWGQTTNVNFDIVDRALNGVLPITLLSTSFTLTTSSGGLSDGQAAAVVFNGSLGSPATVTVAPSNAQKTYIIRNDSNQPITVTQGSGGDVTIPVGGATVVVCTGEGAAARVFEAGISGVNLATGVTGTLPVANGGTGTTSTQFANLTTNVTGTLPVANGGTGRNTITSGALVLGAGTSQVGQLTGSSVGQVPQWNGSTWGVGSLPSGGVTNVTASTPLASSGGATPNISLTGTVPLNRGGTNATTAAGARTSLGLGTIATQNSNSVSISGGSISNAVIIAGLGFTPVQQGGGAGQGTNKVRIGWDGSGLRLQVDNTDQGRLTFQKESLGLGQTWQSVSRAGGVIYQNTTGRPIVFQVRCAPNGTLDIDVGPTTGSLQRQFWGDLSSGTANCGLTIVPNGHFYRASSVTEAAELR